MPGEAIRTDPNAVPMTARWRFRQRMFPPREASVADARRFAVAALTAWHRTERLDDVRLCVSEAATNALIHCGPAQARVTPAGPVVSVVPGEPAGRLHPCVTVGRSGPVGPSGPGGSGSPGAKPVGEGVVVCVGHALPAVVPHAASAVQGVTVLPGTAVATERRAPTGLAAAGFDLRIGLGRAAILVEVRDRGAGRPVRREPGPDAGDGRGLLLVDALADAWGVRDEGVGKTVWLLFRAKLCDGP